jgi:glycosyltransferase involved in cell wall biosynthesis
MVSPLISVVFTCKGRPALTELCLSRLIKLMPQPYELLICYDGADWDYMTMLQQYVKDGFIFNRGSGDASRFSLINRALGFARGKYFMHIENDFYWVDPTCLGDAIKALGMHMVDFIRFELLPFTQNQLGMISQVGRHDICWMKPDTPYRFNFNPHIRNFKYVNDVPFKESGFTKQPEQHHGENYKNVSCCMTGDNFRHLGVYSEGGHFKPYYAERFFNQRGKRETNREELLQEFRRLTDNSLYRKLFLNYLDENG